MAQAGDFFGSFQHAVKKGPFLEVDAVHPFYVQGPLVRGVGEMASDMAYILSEKCDCQIRKGRLSDQEQSGGHIGSGLRESQLY